MNINQMKAFIESVQAASISKAATQLHLTQPAVSQQIQSLENSLGYQLLIRSNKGVQLTEYGKVFYSYAQSFITLWGNLQNDLANVENNNATLQIGTCPAIGQYALPCALYLFKQKYPYNSVSVQSFSSEQILYHLKEHSFQIGFILDGYNPQDLTSYQVLKNPLILVASPQMDLSIIELKELHTIPLILGPENSDLQKSLRLSLSQYGFDLTPLKPLLELDGLESIKSTVRAGHGCSFLPYFSIKKELYSKELKEIKIKGVNLETSFSMVWRKEENLTEAARSFIDFIKNEGVKGFC